MILVFLTYLVHLNTLAAAAGIAHHQIVMGGFSFIYYVGFIFLLWLRKCLEILNIQPFESKKLYSALLF